MIHQDKQLSYLSSRNGECTQNVMAVCDFDMWFTFVYSNWEGTPNDSQKMPYMIQSGTFFVFRQMNIILKLVPFLIYVTYDFPNL